MKIIKYLSILLLCLPILASAQFVQDDVTVLHTLNSEQPGDAFGWVAENLGDINNDGAGDFIVGAPFNVTAGFPFPLGKVYVYSGRDGSELFSAVAQFGTRAGFSVAGLNDVNGDGVNDYVYSEIPVAVLRSGADHSILQVWFRTLENFAYDVNNAGDLDGDGADDVLIGAEAASYSAARAGRLYAFSSATGALLWTYDGPEAGARLGRGVGPVGDLNADGIPEVVVSAPGAGHKGRGAAYVLSGDGSSVLHELLPVGLPGSFPTIPGRDFGTFGDFHTGGGHDVNADGVPDIYIGDFAARRGTGNTGRTYVFSGADGSRMHVLDAENNGDGLGPGRIVPDTNGDGYADIFTAAFTFGENSEGKAYVYSGADQTVLREMTGTVPAALLGVDATYVEDVNADGKNDWILTGTSTVHVVSGD